MRHSHLPPIAAVALLIASNAHGRIKPVSDLPSSIGAQQAAFVDAWRAFRNDIDGMTGVRRHPEMIREWFQEMPDYLLKDVLRLATAHEAVYQAAYALLARSPGHRAFVKQLLSRYRGTTLGDQLTMLLVRSGEKAVTASLLRDLKGATTLTRTKAAILLAGGGNPDGMSYLKKSLSKFNEQGAQAAVGLGRYGPPNVTAYLKKWVARFPKRPYFQAALGELDMRRVFPDIYRIFLTQHRSDRTRYIEHGLYETWMIATYIATREGATTAPAFHDAIVKMRKAPPIKGDEEGIRRQLSSFLDFLDAAMHRLKGPTSAPWPARFAEAIERLKWIKARGADPDELVAERISAALSLIVSTGEAIGYPALAEPTPGVRAISPFGERTLDGNLSTSWQFVKAGELTLEHPGNRRLLSAQIMLGCADTGASSDSAPVALVLTGRDAKQRAWKKAAELVPTIPFFQKIDIDQNSTSRITLHISSRANKRVCISEIRLTFSPKT